MLISTTIAGSTRLLGSLAKQAGTIAVIRVVATSPRDGGRILVHTIEFDRVVAGRDPGDFDAILVEVAGPASRALFPHVGVRAVALLSILNGSPYLRSQVGERYAFEAVGGHDGVFVVEHDEAACEVINIVEGAKEATKALEVRGVAFAQLRSSVPRLVENGALELANNGPIGTCSLLEQSTIAATLANAELSEQTRGTLMHAVGVSGAPALAAALEQASTETPRLLRAALHARVQIGQPPSPEELDAHLRSTDLRCRAAAVSVLGASHHPRAAALLEQAIGPMAPREVRLAAIDALENLGGGQALELLSRTFEADDRSTTQASARAILAIGGEAADETLLRLALEGNCAETRLHAATVLVTTHPATHAVIERLMSSDVSPEILAMLDRRSIETPEPVSPDDFVPDTDEHQTMH